MTTKARLSFELNEEMLDIIGKEFNIGELIDKFKQTISGKTPEEIEKIAEDFYGRYGVDWIRKSLQLGEEYPDRTYEVLREAFDATGGSGRFPLLPQRFLEIGYLSTFDMELLPIMENNPRRLVYRVEDCKMFQTLGQVCGENVSTMMPCRHACLSACRTLFNDLDYPEVMIDMEASSSKEGFCQFSIKRI